MLDRFNSLDNSNSFDRLDKLIEKSKKTPLTKREASEVFEAFLQGKASTQQIESFLLALSARGETPCELYAGAQSLRQHSIKVLLPHQLFIDTCGTGGDGANTYNISTATAFVVSACGVGVAKHGNKAQSSKTGSAELLEALGVKIDLTAKQVEKCLCDVNMGFMFAPYHHQAVKYVALVRQKLKQRTIFNLLGPLANPANAPYQLLGVYDKKWLLPMAQALRDMGCKAAWVVAGADGLDEITVTDKTHIAELKNGTIKTFTITPQEGGLSPSPLSALKGGSAEENKSALLAILGAREPAEKLAEKSSEKLEGKSAEKLVEKSAEKLVKKLAGKSAEKLLERPAIPHKKEPAYDAYRDIVLLNAAAALLIVEKVSTLKEGVLLARNAIESGKAYQQLQKLITCSNGFLSV